MKDDCNIQRTKMFREKVAILVEKMNLARNSLWGKVAT